MTNDRAPIEAVATEPVAWDQRYRMLAAGEIIQDGDEVLTDSHLGWHRAKHAIGQPAPDPLYTAHRMYRRLTHPTGDSGALREALAAMLARFKLYAGENNIHAGQHDKALIEKAEAALSKGEPGK